VTSLQTLCITKITEALTLNSNFDNVIDNDIFGSLSEFIPRMLVDTIREQFIKKIVDHYFPYPSRDIYWQRMCCPIKEKGTYGRMYERDMAHKQISYMSLTKSLKDEICEAIDEKIRREMKIFNDSIRHSPVGYVVYD
jgi:hypothetical protein